MGRHNHYYLEGTLVNLPSRVMSDLQELIDTKDGCGPGVGHLKTILFERRGVNDTWDVIDWVVLSEDSVKFKFLTSSKGASEEDVEGFLSLVREYVAGKLLAAVVHDCDWPKITMYRVEPYETRWRYRHSTDDSFPLLTAIDAEAFVVGFNKLWHTADNSEFEIELSRLLDQFPISEE